MSGNGDDVADLGRKFGIADLMKRAAAAREKEAVTTERPDDAAESPLPPMDELARLPRPGDPYKAYARHSSQMLPTLHLLAADGQTWSFPYAGLVEGPHRLIDESDPGKGAVLVMRFAASVPMEVLIAGTRSDELHIYLAEHRIRWVREWPPGRIFTDNGSPVVRSLLVRPIAAKMMKIWPISPQGWGTERRG